MIRDLRYALRTLFRQPGTSLVVVLTLAVGIGAGTALFTFLAEGLWTRVHAPDVARFFYVRTDGDNSSYHDALLYKEALAEVAEVAPWAFAGAILTPPEGEGARQSVFGVSSAVSPEHFRFFGVHGGPGGHDFVLGRGFLPEEYAADGPRVAVLDYTYWRHHLGADPDVLGKAMRVNGVPFTVVGVAPRGFENTGLPHQIYMPMSRLDDAGSRPRLENRNVRNFTSLLRLPPGVGVAEGRRQVEARLDVLARRLDAEEPLEKPRRLTLVHVEEGDATSLEAADLMLTFAVGLLLAVACANVANLLLSRAAGRRREIAVQAALGAGRLRLGRRLLLESLVLAVAGGVLGLAVNRALTALMDPFYTVMPIGFGGLWEGNEWRQIDERVLGFTLAVAIVTGCLFGLAPILHVLRADLVSALKGADGGPRPGRRWGARQLLVVAQVAMSAVLVLATTLLVRSLDKMEGLDLGFDTDHQAVLALAATARADGPAATREAQRRIYEAGRASLAGLPGVEAATIAAAAPGGFSAAIPMELPDRPGERFDVDRVPIGPDFFATYGIGPVRGRTFNDGDRAGAVGAVIVDEVFAAKLFAGREALGQEIRLPDLGSDAPDDRFVVVGVAPAVRQTWKPGPPQPRVYLPLGQYIFGKQVLATVRVKGPPAAALPLLRQTVSRVHPDLALLDDGTYDRFLVVELWAERLRAMILSVFSVLGLAVACLGTYSVMSCSVSFRRRELGIRTAIGATVRDLSRLVLGEALRLVAWGVAAGGAAALAAGTLMRGLLYGVAPYDPATFLALPLVLVAVAVAAAWVPARRAGRVDPMLALREE